MAWASKCLGLLSWDPTNRTKINGIEENHVPLRFVASLVQMEPSRLIWVYDANFKV